MLFIFPILFEFYCMETIIDQFLTVLKFNHYFILDRLRQRYPESQFKEILNTIMRIYQEQLSQQYELLSLITIKIDSGLITTYDTQSNIREGVVNLYENNQVVKTCRMDDVKQVKPMALYHKVMPFEDIVTLAHEKHTNKTKKYHNKNFDKIIDVTIEVKPITNQNYNTPQKKFKQFQRKIKESEISKLNTAVSRKLMIVSDSESNEINELQAQKQINNVQMEAKVKENIIIQKLGPNQCRKVSEVINQHTTYTIQDEHSRQFNQKTYKKTNDPIEIGSTPTPHRSLSIKAKRQLKLQQRKKDMEKQSNFMVNWIKKIVPQDKD